ncbi:Type II secretion system protein K [Rubrivivax sp. A210]|uniref:type II secretion system minor pseudopilin GspK n=1 Tax=Rubrivivax sp. A210 TaxID=2772301 RepID=UPI001918F334|nr:type II secretion system minor pseudopilin GspK [Rubrivivax sp. A210]CAD5372568.1 Type II secretion system protein K [Rubrivivax sp. A210]
MQSPRRSQRGAALLLAMIIMVLVVTATAGMVWQQSRAISIESAERARAQAAWILNGALDWARLILREDQRKNPQGGEPHDSLDEPWATPLAESRLSTFLAADRDNNAEGGPEAFISGQISDAQARFNLAGVLDSAGKPVPAQVAALERLCNLAGTASDTAARIVAVMRAATNPGDDDPLQAPLRPARLADLAWQGLDAATLAVLDDYLDLLPAATPVNVNTARREVLVAAIDGIDLGSAERLVQQRQRKAFASLADVTAQLPGITLDSARVSVASAYFLVAGRLRLEDRVLEERSLLVRRDGRIDVLRRERHSFSASGG